MGIIVNKESEERTELSKRVTTSLRERAARTSGEAKTDFAEGSEYGKGLRRGGRFGWVWFALIFLAVISLVIIWII